MAVIGHQTIFPMKLLSLLALALVFVSPVSGQVANDFFARYEKDVTASVTRALDFLISQESTDDGTFPEGYGRSTGISSLVGMALLSTGHRPGSGKYGEAINRRIDFALKNAKDNGLIESGDHGHGPMYAHNISTLFLSECSGIIDPARQKKLDQVLGAGLKVLLDAQAVKKDDNQQGGWRYFPNSTDSDLSCSGWALMALKSAKLNGAAVPTRAIDDAVKYIKRRHNERQNVFGYQGDSDHKDSLTGMAILCLELCGSHGDEMLARAGDYVLANSKQQLPGDQFEYYGNYYNAQAMFQLGGKYWEQYAAWMYETYLAKQKQDGSWEGNHYGKIYTTSMMALSMTVPYRQLPIYQRDERVDEDK